MESAKSILRKHYDADNSVDENAIIKAMEELAQLRAKQYSKGKSSAAVFRENHEKDFIAGYEKSLSDSKAPELLEMLKEANKVIEWYMENSKPDDNHTDFFNIGMNQRTQIEQLINSATTI